MFSALALGTVVAHVGGPFFGGFGFFFLLVPLFWIGIVILIVSLGRRRWRRYGVGPGGMGPWGYGHGAYGAMAASRSAESTLAERFAQGDIDEKEYRARLEVLRANNPSPFTPPAGK